MSPANREIARQLYDAINGRDFDRGFELLAPDFEWHVPDRALFAGIHRGHEEVRRLIDTQLEVFEDVAIEVEQFFESGDQVVAFVRQRGRGGASGVEVEIRIGHLWTMREGKAVRLQVFPDREKALEAAGIKEQAAPPT
jgi:ketosteroid isomerase-like protein